MEWIETTGRTVEEALEAALDQLGIDERDAEVEVLEEPKTGLFGRLRSEARIRARVRPTRPRPKAERPERSRKRPSKARSEPRQPAPPRAEPRQPAPPRAEPRQPAPPQAEAPPEQPREGDDVMDREVPLSEQAEIARAFLEGLLARLALTGAAVGVREVDEETVELRVEGSDLGFLIGPRGTTLNALQDVTRTVVNRKTGSRNGRLLVDVAGYREKRKVALERFVQDVAANVKADGVAKTLEPMGPADRKVVHDAINQIDGVSTTSEGEEPNRRVVIQPE